MGDISRKTFDKKKHYSAVLQQQGRVQLDADWNEQVEIERYLSETAARDIIGEAGAPSENAGFNLQILSYRADPAFGSGQNKTVHYDLLIGTGRFYVHGILCEHEANEWVALDSTLKGDVLTPPSSLKQLPSDFKDGDWVELQINSGTIRHETVYRKINKYNSNNSVEFYSEDTKSKTTQKNGVSVKALRRVTTFFTQPSAPSLISSQQQNYLAYLDVWKQEITALDDPLLLETSLGGPDTTTRLKTVWQVKFLPIRKSSCEALEWNQLIAQRSGLMEARVESSDIAPTLCEPIGQGGYRGLENQLYRVEIHQATNATENAAPATFKWSRENASVETLITSLTGNNIIVNEVGKDENLRFKLNHWVEIVDKISELRRSDVTTPRKLYRITAITGNTITVDSVPDLAVANSASRPWKLRQWDQQNGSNEKGIAISGDWQPLEHGIQVRFAANATYVSGDHWLIPARSAPGTIEWSSTPQERDGVIHHFAKLAVVVFNKKGVIKDCRQLFSSLTKCNSDSLSNQIIAVQYIYSNEGFLGYRDLQNDQRVRIDKFAGVKVNFDSKIDVASLKDPTFYLTAYFPLFININNSNTQIGFTPVVPLSSINLVEYDSQPVLFTSNLYNFWLSLPAEHQKEGVRVNLTLKGRFIWANQVTNSYLDGETFGQPGASSLRPTTELNLPSGDGRPGGDFEMWFWLVPPPPPLQVLSVTFHFPNTSEGKLQDPRPLSLPQQEPPLFDSSFGIPNKIEVNFTEKVDPDTITVDSVEITIEGNLDNSRHGLQPQVSEDGKTVTISNNDQQFLSGEYTIRFLDTIKSQDDARLDGNPLSLQSGDRNEGGDFSFKFKVKNFG